MSERQSTSTDESPKRDKRGYWLPGQSPNPGGRPKAVKHVQDLARLHTVDAITALKDIVIDKDQPAAARVSAAQVLLDRGWGKAPQSVELTGKDGESLFGELSEEQLIDRLMAKRRERERKRLPGDDAKPVN